MTELQLPFAVTSQTAVSGGSLNDAFRVELAQGGTLFVKTSADAVPGSFGAEAAGLGWIAAAEGAPPVPEVVAVGPDFLALSWIEPSGRDEEALGRGLAALHQAGAERFGQLPPGVEGGLRIGPLLLPVATAGSWVDVYRDGMLLGLARNALARGALSPAGAGAVQDVCERLEDLAGPDEPPARLHGDLWSGNALGNYLIDPTAYGGHREVDLAMMRLFGGFGERCFAAYDETFPLGEGWAERVGLWQLFPLLVHAVLFGGGYGAQAASIARRYAG